MFVFLLAAVKSRDTERHEMSTNKNVNVSLTDEVKRAVRVAAAVAGKSMSAFLAEFIKDGLLEAGYLKETENGQAERTDTSR
jgi:predicted HicB family RNase H-like nuclease